MFIPSPLLFITCKQIIKITREPILSGIYEYYGTFWNSLIMHIHRIDIGLTWNPNFDVDPTSDFHLKSPQKRDQGIKFIKKTRVY